VLLHQVLIFTVHWLVLLVPDNMQYMHNQSMNKNRVGQMEDN